MWARGTGDRAIVDRSRNVDRLLIGVELWTNVGQNNTRQNTKASRKNNFKWFVLFCFY